jgi:hypothetical protein
MKDPLDIRVCVAMIRSELSGYEGYPRNEAGEHRFGRALQECAVSVAHASAILAKFTQKFPTVQDIIDTALNLLPQFEIQHSQLLEWEREFGKAAPLKPDFNPNPDPPYVEINRKVKEYLILQAGGHWPGWAKITWKQIYEAQEQLGYPLNRDQLKMLGRG